MTRLATFLPHLSGCSVVERTASGEMEARIHFHARWLGIAYRACMAFIVIGLAVCGWAQWENCCG